MKNTFQATLAALLLSSVAVAPLATLTVIATTDAAYAKSDKAGGNGNGKGGDKSQGASKSSAGGSSKGKSGTKSASTGGGKSSSKKGGVTVEGLFQKLTGKSKKSGGGSAKVASTKATGKPAKGPMHPSNLGNMNGALHANINAVLAHIRNGNTNGPVGMLAALAVANSNAEGAQEIIDQQAEFDRLAEALGLAGYASIADYYAALDGVAGETDQGVEDAKAALALDPENEDLKQDLIDALALAGYDSDTALEDYEADAAGTPGIEPITELDEAIADLGGDSATRGDITDVDPTDEEVDGAQEALDEQAAAEDGILAYWNKSDTAPEETEGLLLEALNERLMGHEEEIAAAIAEAEAGAEEEETSEEATECLSEEECTTPEEEVAEATE